MGWPADGKVRIKTLRADNKVLGRSIKRIELLGAPQALTYTSGSNALEVTLPDQKPGDYAHCLKIT